MSSPAPRARRAALALALSVATGASAGGAAAAGPPIGAFVPDGFRIEKRIRADVAGDRAADAVLVLVRTPGTPQADGGAPRAARRLVVLAARPGGGFTRVGEGRRILRCTRCGGAFFGVATTPVRVRVRGGVVITEQEHGSRAVTLQRFRLRVEGARGVRLIGADVRTTDRLTGARVASSTDFLTGEREVVRVDARGRRSVRRVAVPARTIRLEAVVAARLR